MPHLQKRTRVQSSKKRDGPFESASQEDAGHQRRESRRIYPGRSRVAEAHVRSRIERTPHLFCKVLVALADKIKHPTFGEGIVNKLIYPNKVEVIFQSDVKILIHAGEHRS